MKLADATRWFASSPCHDAYVDVDARAEPRPPCFWGHLAALDGALRESQSAARRWLTVPVGAVMPTRCAVRVAGQVYVLGVVQRDEFAGQGVRLRVLAHGAPHLATIRSLAHACWPNPLNPQAQGVQAYVAQTWLKDSAQPSASDAAEPAPSPFVTWVHVHLSASEALDVHDVVDLGPQRLWVRAVRVGESGLKRALCEPLACGSQLAMLQVHRFDPLTNHMSGFEVPVDVQRLVDVNPLNGSVSTAAPGQSRSMSAAPTGPTVQTVPIALSRSQLLQAMPSLSRPEAGMKLVMASQTWVIHSVLAVQDAWVCACTPLGEAPR